jgi:glycosyltransferase involved in cell wall biosynthesis
VKILISAYACEPERGSEPGAGWLWALAATRIADVWVITRANNRERIEAELAREPRPRLNVVYVDLPPRARFWKRGNRGIRLYYVVWQFLALRQGRRLQREIGFDVVHHLTFATMWLPALACLTGPPFVLGPVGGGQRVPLRLYPVLGPRAALAEAAFTAARAATRLNPLVRIAWRRAQVILVQTEETLAALPRRFRSKAIVRPNAVVPDLTAAAELPRRVSPTAVYAGRLNRFKAVELALEALVAAPNWRLVIIGRGPDAARLRRVSRRLGLDERVTFVPWLSARADLWRLLASCDAFLFPSLKEGAPLVVAEAQALGLPVIALDRNGPRTLARTPHARIELVQGTTRRAAFAGLAAALARVEAEPGMARRPDFGVGRVIEDLEVVYRTAARLHVESLEDAA